MGTRKRLDGQMNPLMTLEIMVAIEALRTLIALERSILGRAAQSRPGTWVMWRRGQGPSVHLLLASEVAAVELGGNPAGG